jgi:sulfite oxidase
MDDFSLRLSASKEHACDGDLVAFRFLRRRFLQSVACGAGVLLCRPFSHLALSQEASSNRLIVRQEDPYNAEPALNDLVQDWITPVDRFFVRSHAAVPNVDRATFRLRVEGLVEKPIELSLKELGEKFRSKETVATLTCAGNRRSEFKGGKIPGVAWEAAAIGNALWQGVLLAQVLKAAGIKENAKHIWFEGADSISQKGETFHFGGSIPLERVMGKAGKDGDVMLATSMNGQQLTAAHGAPLRAVVPGYIGARSVKWLNRIVVSDRSSSNHFVAHAYKVVSEDTIAAHESVDPIYQYVLNSAGVALDNSNGKHLLRGYALPSGGHEVRIKQVEFSLDKGETWKTATLESPAADFCWQLWSAEVPRRSDVKYVLVRAEDTSGAKQPREMAFNLKGYQYNAWHPVKL